MSLEKNLDELEVDLGYDLDELQVLIDELIAENKKLRKQVEEQGKRVFS